MPYINCNGTTYSRYDTSQIVVDCIKEQDLYYRIQSELCSADPECAAARESKTNFFIGSLTVTFTITLVILIIYIRKLLKES